MARIFVLDDDIARHKTFALNLRGQDSLHVQTYDSAVKALQEGERFDVFFLDHDLNDFGQRSIGPTISMYGSGVRELTGADFCRFIANELSEEKHPDLIVIHSWNDSGAQNMVSILKPTGIPLQVQKFNPTMGRQIS